MMRSIVWTSAFLAIVAISQFAHTADKPSMAQQPMQKQTHLGVSIEPLPEALATQLSQTVPKSQGVLITQVAKDSPAAKAGLQRFDILLAYGNERLQSPDQLTQLVRNDKAGHEVALTVVRSGKVETDMVTLDEQEPMPLAERRQAFRFAPDERMFEMFREGQSKDNWTWDTFDALKLTRVNDKQWRAEIEYRTKDGKKEHKSFEGSREQIAKDIKAEKDLPAIEQKHLLRALNCHDFMFDFDLPPFDRVPNG